MPHLPHFNNYLINRILFPGSALVAYFGGLVA